MPSSHTGQALRAKKASRYIGRFFDGTRRGTKIIAKIDGNHGTYVVSIEANSKGVSSACSCYIGRGGGCHHCVALAHTFLRSPADTFPEIQPTPREAVGGLPELQAYLAGVTLEDLLVQLMAHGITQKAFAEGYRDQPANIWGPSSPPRGVS